MEKIAIRLRYFFIISLALLFSCKSNTIVNGIPDFDWISEAGAKSEPANEKVYNVADFGAVSDTSVFSTKAIQKAIDKCSENGGGMVTFDKGSYLTGTIYLKNNVNLNIPEGVTIFGSRNIDDYPVIYTRVAGIEMLWPSALITAVDQNNISITGSGSVYGNGKVFWDKYWNMRRDYEKRGLRWIVDYDCRRPRLILFQRCKNVTVRGNSYYEAGFWTIHILYSQNVTVENVKIDNNNAGYGPSTDGIDIDSSNRILVQDCDISCNDDNFCLKAGRDADGLRVNIPTEYVVIKNCHARSGGGLFTCGSETSGHIRNIVCYNMTAEGTSAGLRFKSALNRGGSVENIWLANIEMKKVNRPLSVNLNWNPSYSYSKMPEGYSWDEIPEHWKKMLTPVEPMEKGVPKVRNIHFTDIYASDCGTAVICNGVDNSSITGFELNDVAISAHRAGNINWARDWKLSHVNFTGENGAQVSMKNTVNIPLYK